MGGFAPITWEFSAWPLANIITYFQQSNLAGQVIIIVLIFCSVAAWSIMAGKFWELNRMRQANLVLERRLKATESVLVVDPKLPNVSGPHVAVARAALQAYHRTRGGDYAMGHVENALQRAVSESSVLYETRMVLLGTLVSGAPFLGLLGTVWGVMDAFGSLGTRATATIGDLAPGVSGALLTTVAGLLVAIPAVFGYNYLLTKIKVMVTELESFASHLADRIELEAKEE